jgi:hypothetical protein
MQTLGARAMRLCKDVDLGLALFLTLWHTRYIFDVWQAMMSGAAIDDQRASRIASASERPKPDAAGQPSALHTEDSDEEFDPNDIVQTAEKSKGSDNYDSDSASEYE